MNDLPVQPPELERVDVNIQPNWPKERKIQYHLMAIADLRLRLRNGDLTPRERELLIYRVHNRRRELRKLGVKIQRRGSTSV